MTAAIQADAAAVCRRFYGSARHSVQRDTFPYNDTLAAEIGCKPPLLSLDVRLMCKLWLGTVGPALAAQTRPTDCVAGNSQSVEAERSACMEWSRLLVTRDV
jgi:hypothetical protein